MPESCARRGANAIEFALVAPVLLFVIYACLEFGYCMFLQSSLHYAAHAGAREGAIAASGEDASGRAVASAERMWRSLVGRPGATFTVQLAGTGRNQFLVLEGVLPSPTLAGLPGVPKPEQLRATVRYVRQDP